MKCNVTHTAKLELPDFSKGCLIEDYILKSFITETMNLPPYVDYPIISDNKIRLRQIIASDMIDLLEISYYDTKKNYAALKLWLHLIKQKIIHFEYFYNFELANDCY
jgi:hypothetical protein